VRTTSEMADWATVGVMVAERSSDFVIRPTAARMARTQVRRLARVLFLAFASHACLRAQTSPLSQVTPSDSLGLTALNRAFGIFKVSPLTNAVRLGTLAISEPEFTGQGLGVTTLGVGVRGRPDSIQVDLGFEWNSGDALARVINDSAIVDRIDVLWRGRDVATFIERGEAFVGALRSAPGVAACVNESDDVVSSEMTWSGRETAWFAGNWISTLTISGRRRRGDTTHFTVHYRAFLFREVFRPNYVVLRKSKTCLANIRHIAGLFTLPNATGGGLGTPAKKP
jgi:hypothetical protein